MVRHDRAAGFAQACNDGAELAAGSHLVFLNNDTLPESGWLEALRAHADLRPLAAVCGARLLYPDGTVQHAGICFRTTPEWDGPLNLYAGLPGDHPAVLVSRPLQAVTGACLRIEREVFQALGGFDPSFDNGYEDVDLCLRVRESGREVEYCAEAVVTHLEGTTRGMDGSGFNERRFSDRWAGRYEPDELALYARDGLITLNGWKRVPEIAISPLIGIPARPDIDQLEVQLLESAERQLVLAAELGSRPGPELRRLELQHGSSGARMLARPAVADHATLTEPIATTDHLTRLIAPLRLTVSDAAPPGSTCWFPGCARPTCSPDLWGEARTGGAPGRARPAGTARGHRRPHRPRRAPDPPGDRGASGAAGGRRARRTLGTGAARGLPARRFLSTTWWTAHVAHRAIEQLGGGEFVALIQEHEPLTLPNGSFAAAAEEALEIPAPGDLLQRPAARSLPPVSPRGVRGNRRRRTLGGVR